MLIDISHVYLEILKLLNRQAYTLNPISMMCPNINSSKSIA